MTAYKIITQEAWDRRFKELERYKVKFGTCNVTRGKNSKYLPLLSWVQVQRMYYRLGTGPLTKENIDRLNEIGFRWENTNKSTDRISNDAPLNELKRVYKLLGRVPTLHEIVKHGKYSAQLYYKRFNTIKSAREKAGLDRNIKPTWGISEENLLNDLKRIHTKLKRVPSVTDINKHSKYNYVTFAKKFGGIVNARASAGLVPAEKITRKGKIAISNEELLNDLKRLYKLSGKVPTVAELSKHGKYSYGTYENRFGGMVKAREKAGLPKINTRKKRITDKELLDELKRLYKVMKKLPTPFEIQKYGKYSASAYYRRFGNMKTAREKAGVP